MNLKNFVKKKLEKDNTLYIVIKKIPHTITLPERLNLTSLTKYLKANENKILNVQIKLVS